MKKLSKKIRVEENIDVMSEWAISESYDGSMAVAIAHGAGNDMHSPFVTHVHEALARSGALTIKFNFPYKEQGRRLPDRAPRLMQTWRRVIDSLRNDKHYAPERLVLAGKSLGGRMASMIAADGMDAMGLVFFGYPLHPARQPEKLRADHLKHIRCPMLFIQGSRDPLCDLGLLDTTLRKLETEVKLHIIEGADHSFRMLKKANRTEPQVWQEIVEVTDKWIKDRE